MYLYGSLASGDFDRESDVDYVVVTDTEIPDETFQALDAMHQRIAAMDLWCATQLEGSYLPRWLRSANSTRLAPCIATSTGVPVSVSSACTWTTRFSAGPGGADG